MTISSSTRSGTPDAVVVRSTNAATDASGCDAQR
jgi:hypothetical protein